MAGVIEIRMCSLSDPLFDRWLLLPNQNKLCKNDLTMFFDEEQLMMFLTSFISTFFIIFVIILWKLIIDFCTKTCSHHIQLKLSKYASIYTLSTIHKGKMRYIVGGVAVSTTIKIENECVLFKMEPHLKVIICNNCFVLDSVMITCRTS